MDWASVPVFLDRDGTIIVDKQYLSEPDLAEFEPDAVAGLRVLTALGATLIVVTNQSGVGRNLFGLAHAQAVNSRVDAMLRQEGVSIAGWYLCPHGPGEACRCRKPGPGLVEQAVRDLNIDPRSGYVIGDKMSDVDLATAVGATGILVLTGEGRTAEATARASRTKVAATLLDAAAFVAADLTKC